MNRSPCKQLRILIFNLVYKQHDNSDIDCSDDERSLSNIGYSRRFQMSDMFSSFRVKRVVNYWPGSGLLPLNLNPYTAKVEAKLPNMINLVRIQHYHVGFREAIGEKGVKQSLSDLAGCYEARRFENTDEENNVYPLKTIHDDMKTFFDCCDETFDLFKKIGNGARLELAFLCEINIDETLTTALYKILPSLIAVVKRLTRAYNMDQITSMLKLFTNALRYKIRNLADSISIQQFNGYISELDFVQTVQEVLKLIFPCKLTRLLEN